MKDFFKYFKITILIPILIFVAIGIYLGIKNYNNTWTIEDGHFKSIYEDYDDCINNNLGTKTNDICDDKNKVKYLN